MKTLRSLAAATALVVGPAATYAQTSWDMATPYPESEFHTRNILQFAEDVSEATGGDLDITVHSGASLFKHPEIKRSVQNMFIPMGEVLMANLFNEDPIF